MSFKKNKNSNITNYHAVTKIEDVINALYKKMHNSDSEFFIELKKKWTVIIGLDDAQKYKLLKVKALKMNNAIKYNIELKATNRENYSDFIFYKQKFISKMNLYFGKEIVSNIKVYY